MMPQSRARTVRCVERQAARPGTAAAVAAAAAQKRAHIALAGDAHAQRAVHEHLGLDAAFRRRAGDGSHLAQRQLPREDHARKAHRGQLPHTVRALHAHLRGAVQRNARRKPAHQRRGGKILHDHGVGPRGGDVTDGPGQRGKLAGVDRGVQRHIHAHTARMAERDGAAQLFRRKIARRAARIKMLQPEIDGVRTGEHRCAKHLGVAGGGQYLGPHVGQLPNRQRFSFIYVISRRRRSTSRRDSSAASFALAASSK